jgi:hypothetical protein
VTRELEWTRASKRSWWAHEPDGSFLYDVRMGKGDRWRVRMKGAPIGPKEGFASFEAARDYIDWGGTPNRMGYDRETGEAHD